MAIKAFKIYNLPEPPNPFTNDSAVTALEQGSVTQPIVVDNDVIRSGAYRKGVSGWALNPDGTIEALNAIIAGKITATTGRIGGFSILYSYIADVADSFGLSSVVTDGDDVRFWAGNTFINRATAPFNVTESGIMYAAGAVIDGTSTIGGSTISTVLSDISGNTTNITTNASGISTNVTDISGNRTDIDINAGGISTNVTDISGNVTDISQNATDINLRVEKDDVINQINISIEEILIAGTNISLDGDTTIIGTFSVTTGSIAGLYVTSTTLADSATAANANVLIDTSNSLIRVGPTATDYISIDGANQKIESSNYVSGVFGAGFHIDSNLLEVGNIACRGLIRTAVFQKDVVSVVGGNLAVLDGDVLDKDMSTSDVL